MPNEADPDLDDERRELLRLTLVPGLGPATMRALMAHFGTAAAVGRATLSELLNVEGVGRKTAESILAARREVDPGLEWTLCKRHGVDLIASRDPSYPELLKQIHDPPPLLYRHGTWSEADGVAVALVGSRRSTPYGLRVAEKLARSLARAGVTVVSGLARGIDAAAHRGALKAGGRTIAVLANGLGRIYPPEHVELADQVAASGCLISEMPIRQPPIAALFPQRNRLIAGLCVGVVVVEAAPRSGSLVTAQHALEQGREVFAVPGPIDSLCSRGCHQLLRDGAKLVETVDDVLDEFREDVRASLVAVASGPTAADAPTRGKPKSLSAQELSILSQLDDVPKPADALIATTGLTASQVLATLSVLEVRRLVRRMPGNQFVRL